MSIFASILRSVYKLSGAKKAFALPEDALRKEIEKQNRHRGVFTPTDRKAYYETIAVNGFPMPRLPSYVRKMNTKDREIRILSLADMDDKDAMHYGLNGSPTQVQRIFPPAVNDKKEMWDGSGEELADRLYQKIVDMKFV